MCLNKYLDITDNERRNFEVPYKTLPFDADSA